MATFGDLKDRIADYLIDDSLSSQIGTAINRAIVYYQRERLWFNQTSTSITLTADDPVVPSLPSDFLYEAPDGLVIDYSNLRYPLAKVTPLEYDAMNAEATGRPRYYTYRDEQLEVYFYPDQAYTLKLYYVKKYSALSEDADSNDWTEEAEDLIEAKALNYLFLKIRHEPEMAAVFGAMASDELGRLRSQTLNRIATGNLVIENIIDRGDSYYA